jgi:hypothetical protein
VVKAKWRASATRHSAGFEFLSPVTQPDRENPATAPKTSQEIRMPHALVPRPARSRNQPADTLWHKGFRNLQGPLPDTVRCRKLDRPAPNKPFRDRFDEPDGLDGVTIDTSNGGRRPLAGLRDDDDGGWR